MYYACLIIKFRDKINDLKPESEIETASIISKNPEKCTPENLLQLSKKFCIDLCPHVVLTNEETINSIIDFEITHHITVVSPSTISIYWSETKKFENIPLNRSDVYSSELLLLKEKHALTKFINGCLSLINDTLHSEEDMSLNDFFDKYSLSPKLKKLLNYSVAVDWFSHKHIDKKFDFLHKLVATKVATKRFDTNSKYLMSYNGTLELIHCFLRKSSIMGSTTCYGIPIKKVVYDASHNNYKIIFEEDKYLSAKKILIDCNYISIFDECASEQFGNLEKCVIVSRAILITTNNSQFSTDQNNIKASQNIEFMIIPDNKNDVFIIKLGSATSCPLGLNLVYFYKIQDNNDPKTDLENYIKVFVETRIVKVLWECYYNSKHCVSDHCFTALSETNQSIFLTNGLVDTCTSDDVLKAVNIYIIIVRQI
ncbi:hypothetical protein HZS_6518, partial [Henneguya salminicola]